MKYQNCEVLSTKAEDNKSKMNEDQKQVFNDVIEAIKQEHSKVFFIDGPGGTGKTFVYNTLLAHVRSNGDIALAVASSGIAAFVIRWRKDSTFKI